jgi:hypothetical protein
MLARYKPRSSYDVMAAIACFVALAGGTAYAAATIMGADVVDESLTGADIQNKSIGGARLGVLLGRLIEGG